MPDRQTLTLAGGAVNISGIQGEAYPRLYARGGRVNLAGVAGAGEVRLTQQGQEWRLSLPEGLARADVSITNNATVSVRLGGGGNIAINARNLNILGNGSKLMAGMLRGLGFAGARAGDIDINTTQAVTVAVGGDIAGGIYNVTNENSVGDSGNVNITTGSLRVSGAGARVESVVFGTGNGGNVVINARDSVIFEGRNVAAISTLGRDATIGEAGNGGNVIINTGSLRVLDGADINASTYGKGNGGNVIINARDSVTFDGGDGTGGAATLVAQSGNGNGGNINITTRSLTVTRGADINASTYSTGNGGNVTINARDSVTFDGVGRNGSSSRATSTVEETGKGDGGDINITTKLLSVTGGAFLSTSTLGQGNAGNITITARDSVLFDGMDSDGFSSGAFSTVQLGAVGRGGNIRITTGNLSLSNGAQVNAATDGQGRAGDITFTAPTLIVAGGAQVLAETNSTGNGGSILVNAPVSVNLRRSNNLSPVLSVETSGAGKAGDITINTPSLTLSEQARITATATATATNPQGGGSVTFNASNLNLAGIVGVFAETQGQSPAGTLRLNPYRNQPDLDITLTPQSQISASTSGSGRGGDLIVTAPRSITIAGSGKLAVETSSTGNAGNINIATQQLTLKDGVEISASTSGVGKAGEIGINAEAFTLSGGAKVSTNTSSSGAAGDLTVRVNDRLFLTGQGTGLFASTAPGSTGTGGNIAIAPRLVQIEDGATIAVDSRGRGTGGNISLQADRVTLNRQGSITAETASAQGGNINLDVRDILLLRRNSLISATAGTAQAGGDGGNITFKGKFIVAVPNENSDISANAFTGSGGKVNITAQGIFGIQFRPRLTPLSDITASSAFGIAGVVAINTPNVDPNRGLVQLPVDLTDASRLIVQNCPTGDTLAKPPNEFIVTGRGGLPPTPSEAVNQDAIQVDLVTADVEDAPSVSQNQPNQYRPTLSPESSIVEAQRLEITVDGTVFLVAAESSNSMVQFRDRLIQCHRSNP